MALIFHAYGKLRVRSKLRCWIRDWWQVSAIFMRANHCGARRLIHDVERTGWGQRKSVRWSDGSELRYARRSNMVRVFLKCNNLRFTIGRESRADAAARRFDGLSRRSAVHIFAQSASAERCESFKSKYASSCSQPA